MRSRNWIDPSRKVWSSFGDSLVGVGKGIGSYGVNYFIHTSTSVILNGVVRAVFAHHVSSSPTAMGLVCRANSSWTFVTFYMFHDPTEQVSLLAFGVCDRGTFTPLRVSSESIELDAVHNSLSLTFSSSSVTGIIENPKGSAILEGNIPHIAFPGYAGLMKLYRTKVLATNFEVTPMTDPYKPIKNSIYKYDVFISHSSADKPIVQEITRVFREAGVRYWVDHEQVGIGESVIKKIEEGIRDSKHVLVCLSTNLGVSNWCRAEYGVILHRYFTGTTNKRVLPLYLENLSDDDIPILLYDLRRADYSKKDEFSELISLIKDS
ncbi:MAG: toll/interleukin-1 receptor domain-containing protein [Anaerolineae bacterium]|nr:toll/interleukin-1 receptor domain-containing protein [Anaerolineae bacterium]